MSSGRAAPPPPLPPAMFWGTGESAACRFCSSSSLAAANEGWETCCVWAGGRNGAATPGWAPSPNVAAGRRKSLGLVLRLRMGLKPGNGR